MYEQAISEPHGFLTIRLDGDPGQTFFSKFGENLQRQDEAQPQVTDPIAGHQPQPPPSDVQPTRAPHRPRSSQGEPPVEGSVPGPPPAPRGGYGAARR